MEKPRAKALGFFYSLYFSHQQTSKFSLDLDLDLNLAFSGSNSHVSVMYDEKD